MTRVLVSIMSDQTIPNYIFIKEMFKIGDELLFISSKKMEHKIDWITSTLNYVNCNISKIILLENEEERWFSMCQNIGNQINDKKEYHVNLTGGTKYMSMAIMQIFEGTKSHFYYIPFPKNNILSPKNNDVTIPINYRVGIKEYMNLHNVKYKNKTVVESEEYTDNFFCIFTGNIFSDIHKETINLLRLYRTLSKINNSFRESKKIEIELIVKGITNSKNQNFPSIPNLIDFLKIIEFPMINDKVLYESEIQYLTGGWFEEYVHNLIIRNIKPTDIALGVDIQQNEYTNKNDLDVVFTYGNKLFVIECKTGISKTQERGEEVMFKEIAYKASTIKATLLGLPSNSFICSLSEGKEHFSNVSRKMGILFYDKSYFIIPEKFDFFINEIKNIAKN